MSATQLLIHNKVVTLRVNVKALIEKLIGRMYHYFAIDPKKLSRQWLRQEIVKSMAAVMFCQAEEQTRNLEKITSECFARYGSAVDAFIEENLDLIAEIRMAVSA